MQSATGSSHRGAPDGGGPFSRGPSAGRSHRSAAALGYPVPPHEADRRHRPTQEHSLAVDPRHVVALPETRGPWKKRSPSRSSRARSSISRPRLDRSRRERDSPGANICGSMTGCRLSTWSSATPGGRESGDCGRPSRASKAAGRSDQKPTGGTFLAVSAPIWPAAAWLNHGSRWGRAIPGRLRLACTGQVVELDSWEAHGTRLGLQGDRARDRILRTAGYSGDPHLWAQLDDEPEAVASDLRTLLAALIEYKRM